MNAIGNIILRKSGALNKGDIILWGTLLVWILFSLLNTAVSIFYTLDSGISFSYHIEFIWHFIYNLPLLFLVPGVVMVAERFRLDTNFTIKHIGIHLLGATVFMALFSVVNSFFLIIRFGTDSGADFFIVNFLYYLDIRLFLYALIVMGYYAIYYHHKTNTEYYRELILKEKIGEAKLDTLKKEMQPEFLMNVLTEIRSMLYQSPSKADKLIVGSAQIIRKLLDNSREEVTALARDTELLSSYIRLLEERFDKSIIYEEKLECAEQQSRISPALVIMGIAEHLIARGTRFWANAGRVSYHISKLDEDFCSVKISIHTLSITQQEFENWYAGQGWKNIIHPLQQALSAEEFVKLYYSESDQLVLSLKLKKIRNGEAVETLQKTME